MISRRFGETAPVSDTDTSSAASASAKSRLFRGPDPIHPQFREGRSQAGRICKSVDRFGNPNNFPLFEHLATVGVIYKCLYEKQVYK